MLSRAKNVIIGAVVTAKPGTEPGVLKLLANYQTGFGYKFRLTNGWYARSDSTGIEFMNVLKLLKRDH